jgi:RNA polymerase sigma factor (sigma-70 family)
LRRIEVSLRQRLQLRRLSENFIDRQIEDAVAQSLLDYVAALRRGAEIENAAGWIVTNATNRALDEARREARRQRPADIDLDAEALRDPDPVADRGLTRAALPQLFRAIRALSPEERALLSSRFYEEKTTRETAAELFVSETSVRRRSAAALAKLRALLGVEPSGSGDEFNSRLHGALAWLALGGGARVVPRRGPLRYLGDAFASLRAAVAGSRGGEHLQRLLLYGGDGLGAAIKGPIGWAAGACAGAVAVCAVTGVVVGPALSHHTAGPVPPKLAARHRVSPTKPPAPVRHLIVRPVARQVAPAATSASVTEAPAPAPVGSKPAPKSHSRKTAKLKAHKRAKAKQERAHTELHQVEEQTSGIARVAAESGPEEATPKVSASASLAPAEPSETATVTPSSSGSSSKGATSSGEEQAENEFGAFK